MDINQFSKTMSNSNKSFTRPPLKQLFLSVTIKSKFLRIPMNTQNNLT